ncbi:MAG: spermidine synthase [Pseudomonadota bacterium]
MSRPWRIVDSIDTDEGLLDLRQRGETDFLITIGGRVLMNASANISEIVLAQLACAPLEHKKKPRVLVGGLGMGFTLKAALDCLPPNAAVVVAELNPIIVTWCRGPMAQLTDSAVDDPRVTVVIDDVAAVIRAAALKGTGHCFDAIILDLYEGPYKGWEHLYGEAALTTTRSALTADGVLAVWSEDPDAAFEKRLKATRFSVNRQRPGRGGRHVVYIARKTSGAPAGGSRNTGPAGRKLHYRCHFSSCDTSARSRVKVSGELNRFRHRPHLL